MGLLNRINTSQNIESEKLNNQAVKSDKTAGSTSDNNIRKRQTPSNIKERDLKSKIQRKILEQFGNAQDID